MPVFFRGKPKWLNIPLRKSHGLSYELAQENWNDVTATEFANTWTSSSAFSAINVVSYCKDALGYVHLKGTAQRGTPVGAITAETVLTLPYGYRPMSNLRFPVVSGTNGQAVIAAVLANSDGTIVAVNGWTSGWDGAGNLDTDLKKPQDTRFSLDSVYFRAAVEN